MEGDEALMADREKVILALKIHAEGCGYKTDFCTAQGCPYAEKDYNCDIEQMCHDAFELLKEQDNCENCAIAIEDRQPLVRCKDCANGEVCTQSWDGVQYVECHAHEEEGYDHEDGHPLDWFCADGERREEE